jgi:hypothetical protein
LIEVEAPDTKERYDARVIGPREAAVFAAPSTASPSKVPSRAATGQQISSEEIAPFSKLVPAGTAPRDRSVPAATAFRNYIETNGSAHVEIR